MHHNMALDASSNYLYFMQLSVFRIQQLAYKSYVRKGIGDIGSG